jgi:putative ABC transport system substrate-binding protein
MSALQNLDVVRRVAVLWNAQDLGMTMRYEAPEAGAKVLGIAVEPLGVRQPDHFDEAFDTMSREMPDAILMVLDSLTSLNRTKVFASQPRTGRRRYMSSASLSVTAG